VNSQTGLSQSIVSPTDLSSFSFQKSPVLVVESFWSLEERQYFRDAMAKASWKSMQELSTVREDFPAAGNWAKAEIPPHQGQRFLSRLQLPCIQEYIESFPNLIGRHLGFNYY
jgi:SM-20-related protein